MSTQRYQLDATDKRILLALDEDPRVPTLMLSQQLGLARGTVQSRLEKLAAAGVLLENSIRVSPAALGHPVSASVDAQVEQSQLDDAVAALAEIPEVLECLAPAGDTDLRIRIVARDSDHLYRVSEQIRLCPGIERTSTTMFLRQLIPFRTRGLLQD
ncbi:Lrp/AsnC family transcriptional regulator [Zhihengliuella sp.]|uniref:Lrp/AsnC family transcriptional regulator n=1 Tax=Zhihengliuella sp. TaxID=1954483 RepID=UPI002810DF18|nr:Lrp/AsnC family transcriptional regulator [Zhihengliuella sp.]